MQEYVIVWQEKIQIEIHRRQPDGNRLTYVYSENDTDEEIELQSIDLKIKIEEIYRRVRFEN